MAYNIFCRMLWKSLNEYFGQSNIHLYVYSIFSWRKAFIKFKKNLDWNKKKTVILVKGDGKGKFKICFSTSSDKWKRYTVNLNIFNSVQFSSVAQSCLTLCKPMNRSTPGLPVHHRVPESTQTHVHWVGDAIQPPHPLSSPSPPALNSSQH